MNAPRVYAEWVEVFEAFKSRINDGETIEAMENGTFEWQAVTSEMFMTEFTNALNIRMDSIHKRFKRTPISNENELTAAVSSIKRELKLLMRAAKITTLPEHYSNELCGMIRKAADEIQSSLESSADSDRSGRIRYILRSLKVNDL